MSKRLWTADFRRIFLANLFLMVTYNMLMSVFLLFLIERGGTDLQGGIATHLHSARKQKQHPVVKNRKRGNLVFSSLRGSCHIVFAVLPDRNSSRGGRVFPEP